MKIGAENRKQLRILAIFGGFALLYGIYQIVQMNSSSSTPPPSAPAAATAGAPPAATPSSRTANGHAAARVSNAQLDPTLHMEGMLLAESLEYTGSGRNIFSANSVAPITKIPVPVASARPKQTAAPVQPINTGPLPPPPIDLRFFGVATRSDGTHEAFFLKGDDVFLAKQGDIVSRRYRINTITATSAEVTDLQTNNTQRLPLQMQ